MKKYVKGLMLHFSTQNSHNCENSNRKNKFWLTRYDQRFRGGKTGPPKDNVQSRVRDLKKSIKVLRHFFRPSNFQISKFQNRFQLVVTSI